MPSSSPTAIAVSTIGSAAYRIDTGRSGLVRVPVSRTTISRVRTITATSREQGLRGAETVLRRVALER
jgi:hypothetical protein